MGEPPKPPPLPPSLQWPFSSMPFSRTCIPTYIFDIIRILKLHSYFIGTREMSVKPILRFFEPLRIWLYETNNANGDEPGWSKNGASTINFNKGWFISSMWSDKIHSLTKWLIHGFSPQDRDFCYIFTSFGEKDLCCWCVLNIDTYGNHCNKK